MKLAVKDNTLNFFRVTCVTEKETKLKGKQRGKLNYDDLCLRQLLIYLSTN